MKGRLLILAGAALALCACSKSSEPVAPTAPEPSAERAADATQIDKLDLVLESLSDEDKARFQWRHPKETLAFFGIEPGMTVVDTLPGEVWYSGILMRYLGPDGKVIAADYSQEMWQHFGNYSPDPAVKAKWAEEFAAKMNAQRGEGDAEVVAVHYGAFPDELTGTVDAVLVVRAIHHFMRLEAQGGYLTKALADMHRILKPGGIVGVVAHRAPESSSDDWAKGDSGYVKQSAVIAAFEKAGFEFVDSSEINANPQDQPTEADGVWRLPPSLATSRNDPELRKRFEAIGESDRMTLKFRKPL
jgi:predicted methyltransferase